MAGEGASGDVLFSKVEDYYIEGIGGIEWAESILAGLTAVLSLDPGHPRAIALKSAMESSLTRPTKKPHGS
jgi:hypothetical protein